MSDVDTGQAPAETDEHNNGSMDTAEKADDAPGAQSDGNTDIPTDAATFPREVVEKLRKENADWRTRVKAAEDRADKLTREIFRLRVEATGKLADPSDLPFNAELVDSPEALHAAIDELLSVKPHFRARKPSGDAGQGERGAADAGVNLLGLLQGKR